MRSFLKLLISIVIILIIVAGYYFIRRPLNLGRNKLLGEWLHAPNEHARWMIRANQKCGEAPFIFPTDGYIGFIWDDSFYPSHRHQGLDIFGGDKQGKTPVVAAYDGYLTRQENWKASLIVRIPEDPLQPGRQIWNYYTHLAGPQGESLISESFPPGTREHFVKAGTILGQQGNYSGKPGVPVGVHLHFSIVKDNGSGSYLNELDINNTLDPSPYFHMNLNANQNPSEIPICQDIEEEGGI
jgi:murein DD-endopeptidase MepM/ murein hydrolase activator NlpD